MSDDDRKSEVKPAARYVLGEGYALGQGVVEDGSFGWIGLGDSADKTKVMPLRFPRELITPVIDGSVQRPGTRRKFRLVLEVIESSAHLAAIERARADSAAEIAELRAIISRLKDAAEIARAGLELIGCDWSGLGRCPQCGMEHAMQFPQTGEEYLRGFARHVLTKIPATDLASCAALAAKPEAPGGSP